jgi:hypothetical protein
VAQLGEIDICRHQMTGNRMFQNMGMLLFRWYPRFASNRAEQPKELRAIKPSALLADKEIIRRATLT